MTTSWRTALAGLAALVPVAALTSLSGGTPAVAATSASFATQSMEGNLTVTPGTTLRVGYVFAMPGSHPAATVSFPGASVTFVATCPSSPGGGSITVPLDAGPFQVAAGYGKWLPSGDQSSPATYQGALPVPDLCGGGLVSLRQGGTFTTQVQSTDATDPVQIRWHYSAKGSAGGWSGTKSVTPGADSPGQLAETTAGTAQIIVKVSGSTSISSVVAAFPVTLADGGLASRGVYLVSPTSSDAQNDPKQLSDLANRIAGFSGVVYAEPNLAVALADDREFYGWPNGSPTPAGNLPGVFTDQPAATMLRLAQAQARSDGTGILVAVLDTGVDETPAPLTGHVTAGWNYVNDGPETTDVATGLDIDHDGVADSAVGHGTFVAGIVRLVAPGATILAQKVLDSDGYGTFYGAAQAITDATAAGARVINLSFGTPYDLGSNLLRDAIRQARTAGVVVVAAAGNDGNDQPHYPAAQDEALSVAALGQNGTSLAGFSDFGNWVDVAAPGEQIVGPTPGGGYVSWAGTSMAAPFVTGQVALIQAAVYGIRPDKVFDAIEHTSVSLAQNVVRFGVIDPAASVDYAIAHS